MVTYTKIMTSGPEAHQEMGNIIDHWAQEGSSEITSISTNGATITVVVTSELPHLEEHLNLVKVE